MVFEYHNYRDFLRASLCAKGGKARGYSLSAFSDQLSISVSHLSEVLNAKKSLSMELAFKIAVKLDLTDSETQYFCMMVQLEHERDPKFRTELEGRLSALSPKRRGQDLSLEMVKVISNWHHAAIIEMSSLHGFRITPANVALRLGISKSEATEAIQRLSKLELIERDRNGQYRKTKGYLYAESLIPQDSFKEFHRQFLEMTTEALMSQSPQERFSSTDVLAIDSKYLPEVSRLAREFSRALLELNEKSKIKDRVYALITHFIKVT